MATKKKEEDEGLMPPRLLSFGRAEWLSDRSGIKMVGDPAYVLLTAPPGDEKM
jgi:hypothetical protein